MVADVKGVLYLSEIAEMAQGYFHVGNLNNDVEIKAITTDSRVKAPESVFVALVGEKFDGHDYIAKAFVPNLFLILLLRTLLCARMSSPVS